MIKENFFLFGSLMIPFLSWASPEKPNIVIILADDLGYGELGCQGNVQIPTPNIDAIAANGIRFTSGYVTASVCSPSRAALLTGRYQTRFGYEFNPLSAQNEEPGVGLPEEVVELGSVLQDAGYMTGMFGKWHLGGTAKYFPLKRGFDEFFGFLHEGHYYVPPPYEGVTSLLRRAVLPGGGQGLKAEGKIMYHTIQGYDAPFDAGNPIYRGGQPVGENAYLTEAFTREAVDFIGRHKNHPFFVYLPYNAIHSPMQALDHYMEQFREIKDVHRRVFAAMLACLDDCVGKVMDKLKEEGLEDNTLVFFLSDNGGPTRELTSSNAPLRGGKGSYYEGGIRIPFMVQWKKGLPRGITFNQPVISLDIFATVAALAGVPENRVREGLDGVNLIPYLTGKVKDAPHEALFWRSGPTAAIRQGTWKMVGKHQTREFELYNLADDLSEKNNLAEKQPAKLEQLMEFWYEWDKHNQPPLFQGSVRRYDGRWITPHDEK